MESLNEKIRVIKYRIQRLLESMKGTIGFNGEYLLEKKGLIGSKIILDACSICQLKCPPCRNTHGITKKSTVGWGYLKFEDFKKFIDNNPEVKNIELSGHGEIFLNPELHEIIKYGHEKNIELTAFSGANFNKVSEKTLEYLAKYKFKGISIALDGASNETYSIYRIGGSFDNVIKNIKRLNYYKKKYNSEFPKLKWQFVIFGHNEHELPIAKRLSAELGMEFNPVLNWSKISPVKNKEFVRSQVKSKVASREEYKDKNKREYFVPCLQLWRTPFISWDGKLMGCCLNYDVSFGNVFESGLDKCLKSDNYIYMKKVVMGKAEVREDLPCFKCNFLKKVLENPVKRGDF